MYKGLLTLPPMADVSEGSDRVVGFQLPDPFVLRESKSPRRTIRHSLAQNGKDQQRFRLFLSFISRCIVPFKLGALFNSE